MKIAFVTFGCKVNASEDEVFAADLALKGFKTVSSKEADIIVINTCAVTETAAKKCVSYISSLKRKRPHVKIVATGCLASEIGESLKARGADVVVTNGSKGALTEHILSFTDGFLPVDKAIFYGGGPVAKATKTRAFFKIQDGCDACCAYCIIPSLRGAPRSKPFDEAVSEFKELLDLGFKEIVLVGIHIGMYGRGEGYGLKDLVEAVTSLEGDYRVRLSSLEVGEITDSLIDLMAERQDKICSHLHIPLQSGSDRILKKMGRPSMSSDYINAALKAKERIAGLTVGSDVIVGFPSEDEEDFAATVDTLKKAKADFVHVFPYSDRHGTSASLMEGKLSAYEKELRATKLRELWKDETLKSMRAMIGKECRILTEKGGKGHAANYMRVQVEEKLPENTFAEVIITEVSDGILIGRLK